MATYWRRKNNQISFLSTQLRKVFEEQKIIIVDGLLVPVQMSGDRADLTIDTVVYYCTDQVSTCYVDPIRVKVAIVASPDGATILPVDILVKKPGT